MAEVTEYMVKAGDRVRMVTDIKPDGFISVLINEVVVLHVPCFLTPDPDEEEN